MIWITDLAWPYFLLWQNQQSCLSSTFLVKVYLPSLEKDVKKTNKQNKNNKQTKKPKQMHLSTLSGSQVKTEKWKVFIFGSFTTAIISWANSVQILYGTWYCFAILFR